MASLWRGLAPSLPSHPLGTQDTKPVHSSPIYASTNYHFALLSAICPSKGGLISCISLEWSGPLRLVGVYVYACSSFDTRGSGGLAALHRGWMELAPHLKLSRVLGRWRARSACSQLSSRGRPRSAERPPWAERPRLGWLRLPFLCSEKESEIVKGDCLIF